MGKKSLIFKKRKGGGEGAILFFGPGTERPCSASGSEALLQGAVSGRACGICYDCKAREGDQMVFKAPIYLFGTPNISS